MRDKEPVGFGLIGCGAFGNFCLDQFRELDEVKLVGVADMVEELATRTAERLQLISFASVEDLLRSPEIQLVHIATPPQTHYSLALQALAHGKHVLCEKPLAMTREEAREMVDTAHAEKRILAVNLMMRYNPLCRAVGKILDAGLLGAPIHAFLENYAGDDKLTPDHWFWDKSRSGGIFIEHAVHFFDLYNGWFGDGQVETAQAGTRPGAPQIEEQVLAVVRHPQDVLSTFYHGFHQPGRLDRQEFRIVCERGDIRLYEWVPTAIEIDVLATAADAQKLLDLVPNGKMNEVCSYAGEERLVTGRHRTFEADGRYAVTGDNGKGKQAVYGQMVRDLLADQIAAIRDPDHKRLVTENNGYHSVSMAVDATELAALAFEE